MIGIGSNYGLYFDVCGNVFKDLSLWLFFYKIVLIKIECEGLLIELEIEGWVGIIYG